VALPEEAFMRIFAATIVMSIFAAGCGHPGSPTEPDAPLTIPALPILLFGQSNAVMLRDVAVPQSISVVQGGTGISAWEAGQPLGSELRDDAAARAPFSVIVIWQGEHDGELTTAQYAATLRTILADLRARAGQATLPARIVEIADDPSLATVRAAHRLVAGDAGNALISTIDLPRDGVHFAEAAYPIVAERIYRSLR
jgi:hypothetical protein